MYDRISRILTRGLRHDADDEYTKGFFEANPIDGHAFASEMDEFVMAKCYGYKKLREQEILKCGDYLSAILAQDKGNLEKQRISIIHGTECDDWITADVRSIRVGEV